VTAFNTGRYGLFSALPGESNAAATLNAMLALFDAAANAIIVEDVWTTGSSGPADPDPDFYGRAWMWNVVSDQFTNTSHPWYALENEQASGFARGSLIFWTPGGWAYFDPADTLAGGSALKGHPLIAWCRDLPSLATNAAFGTGTDSNAQHLFNRGGNQSAGFVLYTGAALSLEFGSAHGWQILGGYAANQPLGWDAAPALLSHSASGGNDDVVDGSEMAAGWYNSRGVRRLVWSLTSLPALGNDAYLALDPAGRNMDTFRDVVNIRILLQDATLPCTVLPGFSPDQGVQAYFDATTKRLYVRRTAESVTIGGSARDLDDYDRVDIVAEYTGDI
jgi:hypothetical protein